MRFEVRPLEFSPPTVEELEGNIVQIWQGNLPDRERDVAVWFKMLSPDERDRANRYYFERDRARFVAGRGRLRSLLGCYLNLDPQDIQFIYSDRGKPQLPSSSNPYNITFNVSHSHDLVLYAVAQSYPLGIDLELMRPLPTAEKLAERFFTPTEAAVLQALPLEEQQLAFFRGWTRKEAFLKATGVGITQLQSVRVSLQKTAVLERVSQDERRQDWILADLPLPSAYVGAIAVKATAVQFQGFKLN
ncbi:MAG: 4'-phosphopantetheinyl transferase superfamily protein [Jaaginema sp. PMC 1079.18]|nr:4'-phosphopantetheinyl transferase superfamily protein [Jaaginema sp. PMC 1079.18]